MLSLPYLKLVLVADWFVKAASCLVVSRLIPGWGRKLVHMDMCVPFWYFSLTHTQPCVDTVTNQLYIWDVDGKIVVFTNVHLCTLIYIYIYIYIYTHIPLSKGWHRSTVRVGRFNLITTNCLRSLASETCYPAL